MSTAAGLRFRERMEGAIACGATDNPYENPGGLGWEVFGFDLEAYIPDVVDFLRAEQHPIQLEGGTVTSGHFGTCTVTEGEIDLMAPGRADFERVMRYRVCFTTESGQPLTLFGFKDVQGDRLRMWYDTTRVFAEVYSGVVKSPAQCVAAPRVAVGVLEIPAITFLIQLTTFRPVGRRGIAGAKAYWRFMAFFVQALIKPYLFGLLVRTRSDVRRARGLPDVQELLDESDRMLSTAPAD